MSAAKCRDDIIRSTAMTNRYECGCQYEGCESLRKLKIFSQTENKNPGRKEIFSVRNGFGNDPGKFCDNDYGGRISFGLLGRLIGKLYAKI